MESQPLVSVVMPCYNTEKYIATSIESVINQTYTNWELIITDGPSSDNTVSIVKKYCEQDPRIRLIIPKQHQGIAEARHTCIQNAKGDLLAFLDSDDIWVSDKLEKQVPFMMSHNYAFTYGNYEILNSDGSLAGKVIQNGGIWEPCVHFTPESSEAFCGSVTVAFACWEVYADGAHSFLQ